jgi:hypothetical protein
MFSLTNMLASAESAGAVRGSRNIPSKAPENRMSTNSSTCSTKCFLAASTAHKRRRRATSWPSQLHDVVARQARRQGQECEKVAESAQWRGVAALSREYVVRHSVSARNGADCLTLICKHCRLRHLFVAVQAPSSGAGARSHLSRHRSDARYTLGNSGAATPANVAKARSVPQTMAPPTLARLVASARNCRSQRRRRR